jgi:hypothetical protein
VQHMTGKRSVRAQARAMEDTEAVQLSLADAICSMNDSESVRVLLHAFPAETSGVGDNFCVRLQNMPTRWLLLTLRCDPTYSASRGTTRRRETSPKDARQVGRLGHLRREAARWPASGTRVS